MDKHIQAYAKVDGDLIVIEKFGIAYQLDMTNLINYSDDYFKCYQGYKGTEIAKKINEGRKEFVNRMFTGRVLDVGIGSGEFIETRENTFGYDVNLVAKEWLKKKGLWSSNFNAFEAFTFWDVIEHIPNPIDYFDNIKPKSYLFTSIPVFNDINKIRESKHYKPGEHLYYFTRSGFLTWMKTHGFRLLYSSEFETNAGREDILSFAFIREQ